MDNSQKIIKQFYDENTQYEWERLDRHPFEFAITSHFMERYVKPGDSILDIGGGPGPYSLHFLQKGNPVTLVDLSDGNVNFAKKEAEQLIVMGFFAPIMARIPFEGVQNRFLEAIQEKMID